MVIRPDEFGGLDLLLQDEISLEEFPAPPLILEPSLKSNYDDIIARAWQLEGAGEFEASQELLALHGLAHLARER